MMKKGCWTYLVLNLVVLFPAAMNCAAQQRSQSDQDVRITGQVVDAENHPIRGIVVKARRSSEPLDEVRTSDDGSYTLRFAAGGAISSVVYIGLDYCPGAILNVSGTVRHTITKVLHRKPSNGPCPNYTEVKATLSYFDAHPTAFALERGMYADLRARMLPKVAPGMMRQETSLPQTAQIMGPDSENLVIPEGTVLVVELNASIATKPSTEAQPFSVTVREPFEYEGAVISGKISSVKRANRSPEPEGVTLSFAFENIQMLDGQRYGFSGSIEDMVTRSPGPSGAVGATAGAGAQSGAALGIFAGGNKGAAIGATWGSGSTLSIPSGTRMRIRSN